MTTHTSTLDAPATDAPVHPPIPFGLGTGVALTGVVGAVAAFVIAWIEEGLTGPTVTLGVTAGGIIAAWYAGRSKQAGDLIQAGVAAYERDLSAVEDIDTAIPPDYSPPAES